LRALYGQPDRVLRAHFRIHRPSGEEPLWLDLFLPMDEEAFEPYGIPVPAGGVAFADDEHGDPYFFIPGPTDSGDGPVYVLQQRRGTSDLVPVATSLAEFLAWPREYRW
jgi:hypothetical protein